MESAAAAWQIVDAQSRGSEPRRNRRGLGALCEIATNA
jgi:hypothetical protein